MHRSHAALSPCCCLAACLALTGCPGDGTKNVNRPTQPAGKATPAAAPPAASTSAPGQAPAKPSPPPAPVKLDHRHDFDLLANLPLAHLVDRGVTADAAVVGFDKYIRDFAGGWKLGVREDDQQTALTPPRQARLWLPVGSELAGQPLALELRYKPVGSRRVALFVNDKQIGEHEAASGWQRVRQPIPAGLIKAGLNRVRLYFGRARTHEGHRTSAALRYVRLARANAPALPEEGGAKLAAVLARRSGATLRLPASGGVDYYLTPSAGLELLGLVEGGELVVSGQHDGEAPRELARVAPGKPLRLSLAPSAGKALRLMLRSAASGDGETRLGRPRLGASGEARAPAAKRPPRVVFWLIDALRADKLDFYGARGASRPQVKTPHLSQVATEGVVFDPFWVNSNESKAGHASYFTGVYPAIHRVLSRPAKLRQGHVTLAEAFADAGYKTGAFVSNGFISKRWNYDQGFASLRNYIREGTANNAEAVVNDAIKWIDRYKDKPFYLYLGTSDTHVSYRVHKEFIKQYDKPQPYRGRYRRFLSGAELGKIKQSRRPLPARERARIEAIYENELAFNDKHFGRLVAHLKKRGIYDDTLLIITSDHGEEFWEHGSCGHGHSLHREQVSVPMVLRMPGTFPGATKVTTGHDGTDLLPTLLALLGKQPADEVQGESLLPYLKPGRPSYPRAMIASNEADSYALQVGPAKVIARSQSAVAVYDISADPREQRRLRGSRPILAQAALDPLSLFVRRAKRWRKVKWGTPNNLTPAFTREQ